jgi:predicted phage terminase large subunit-like protein
VAGSALVDQRVLAGTIAALSQDGQRVVQSRLTPKLTSYIPHQPTAKQQAFLLLDQLEAFYGGAAAGGKSEGLLMAALQYVDEPGYNALLLRKTYKDLSLPEALMDRAQQWLGPTDARWREAIKTWEFPSGATLTFGYLAAERDKFSYRSAEFHFIGFDELTGFSESSYRFLFSRLRRKATALGLPIRMRSASNPGDIGHEWVKQRFLIEGPSRGRVFIPAKLEDNPHVDRDEYIKSLGELDPVTLRQLLHGDWEVRPAGPVFQRGWFEIVDDAPADLRPVRYWDLAATKPRPNRDPDWTVGCLLAEKAGVWFVLDVRRLRGTPGEVEAFIRTTAQEDGRSVKVYMEQEPGASGVNTIATYRKVLKGYAFWPDTKDDSKSTRAGPASSAAQAGNVKLVRRRNPDGSRGGAWITTFLDEVTEFPFGNHDDQVDAFSGGMAMLATSPSADSEPIIVGEREDSPWTSIWG